MKNVLLFLFVLLSLSNCVKNEENIPSPSEEDDSKDAEQIYKDTGCKPEDVKSITTYQLYKDKDGVKYLYGSKLKDDVESFWIAQYNSSGKQVWEIINKDSKWLSMAIRPKQIKNGDIVIACVAKKNDSDIKWVIPTIISKEGKATFIRNTMYPYYSDIYVFDDFFFCYVSSEDCTTYPQLQYWYTQIGNKGKILNQSEYMDIPQGKTIWTSDSTYINMDISKIERKSLSGTVKWIYDVKLPSYSKCDMNLLLDKQNDLVKAFYKLILQDKTQKDINYNISYSLGIVPVPLAKLTIEPHEIKIKLGESAQLSVSMEPEDATNKTVKWRSSHENVSVDEHGYITGLKEGGSYIIVESEDGILKDSCRVTVSRVHINFVEKEVNIINGSIAENSLHISNAPDGFKVLWESEDPSIVSVDNNGVLKAKSTGTTTIKAYIADSKEFATFIIHSKNIDEVITVNASGKSMTFPYPSTTAITLHSRAHNNSISKVTYNQVALFDGNDALKQLTFPDSKGYVIYDAIYMPSPVSGSDLEQFKYWHVHYWITVEGFSKDYQPRQAIDGNSFGDV